MSACSCMTTAPISTSPSPSASGTSALSGSSRAVGWPDVLPASLSPAGAGPYEVISQRVYRLLREVGVKRLSCAPIRIVD